MSPCAATSKRFCGAHSAKGKKNKFDILRVLIRRRFWLKKKRFLNHIRPIVLTIELKLIQTLVGGQNRFFA